MFLFKAGTRYSNVTLLIAQAFKLKIFKELFCEIPSHKLFHDFLDSLTAQNCKKFNHLEFDRLLETDLKTS